MKRCNEPACAREVCLHINKKPFCSEHAYMHPDATIPQIRKAFNRILIEAYRDDRLRKSEIRNREKRIRKQIADLERLKYLSNRAEVMVTHECRRIARANAVVDLCVPQMKRFAADRSKTLGKVYMKINYHDDLRMTNSTEEFYYHDGVERKAVEDAGDLL